MPWLFDIFLFTEIYCVNMALRLSNYVVIPRILHGLTKNTISEIPDDVFFFKELGFVTILKNLYAILQRNLW